MKVKKYLQIALKSELKKACDYLKNFYHYDIYTFMSTFLLMSIPLFYLTISSFMNDIRGRIDDSYKPLTYGIICFVPVIVLYNIIRVLFFNQTFSVFGIYIYHFFHDYFIQFAFAALSYFLVFGQSDLSKNDRKGLNRLFAFLCGFFSFWSINDAIINYPIYNLNNILLVPVFRICTISLFCLFLDIFQNNKGIIKISSIILWALLPFITATGSLLWRLSYNIPLIIIMLILPAISGYLMFRKERSKLTI